MAEIQVEKRTWRSVLNLWRTSLALLVLYPPWEDSMSGTHYGFIWSAPVSGARLDLMGIIFNVSLLSLVCVILLVLTKLVEAAKTWFGKNQPD